MALDMTNSGAALVPGAPLRSKTRRVRVVRPFMVDGEPAPAGAELTLPSTFAAEMVGANKAVYLQDAPEPAPAPAKPAKTSKEQSHAGQ